MASVVQGERYLVIEVGHVFTRAFLFDVVEGRYRLVSQSTMPSTWEAPVRDAREGVLNALEALEQAAGLHLLDEGELLTPSRPTGEGVDRVALLISAGPPMRVAVMGILEGVSVRSGLRALEPFPIQTELVFHLNDGRTDLQRLEALLNHPLDLVMLTGGVNHGSQGALWTYARLLLRAAEYLPEGARPVLLFAGNEDLAQPLRRRLERAYQVYLAPNVRPTLGRENLQGVRKVLREIYRDHLLRIIPGADGLLELAHVFEPVPQAWRRIAQLLAAYYDASGFLGIYQGSGLSFCLQGRGEQVRLRCFAYGLGHGLPMVYEELLENLSALRAWAGELDDPHAELLHKLTFPETVPTSTAEAWWERGLAYWIGRHMLTTCLSPGARRRFTRSGLDAHITLVLLGGGVWSSPVQHAATTLTALDLLQPRGFTVVWADITHLFAPLGILARLNPLVPVHLLDSTAFTPLAVVVAPWGFRPRGRRPVARVTLRWEPRQQLSVELRPGELRVLPLPPGYRGYLEVQPAGGVDVGAGPGRSWEQEVPGSWMGVVLDARGRPLVLPQEPQQQWEQRSAWWQALQRQEA